MTNKTLYIHIGHYKTGTTALQSFLNNNASKLTKAYGVDYARQYCLHNKHSIYAFSILQDAGVTTLMHGYNKTENYLNLWRDLFKRVRASASPVTVISSEEFIRIGGFDAAAQRLTEISRLKGEIDVKIIVYLRNPQDHLKSWYNQLVKMRISVSGYDTAILGEIEGIHYDYARALAPWVDSFGQENLIVREYFGSKKSSVHIFDDFMSIFSSKPIKNLAYPGKDPNPRMDPRMMEIMRLMQNLDFSKQTIDRILAGSRAYIEQQDRLEEGPNRSISEIQEDSLAGLKWLSWTDLDLQEFEQKLPQQLSDKSERSDLLLGFVLSELIYLRQRVNKFELAKMERRLENLEEHYLKSEK